MKKTLKKSLIILVMMLTVLMLWTGKTNAASARISATGSVTVGQNVSVTVNFGEKMKAIQFHLDYDQSKLDYVGVNIGGYGAGTKSFIYANLYDQADVSSVTFTFKTKAAGKANFSASGFILSNATQDGLPASAVSATTTINEKVTPKPDPKPDQKPNNNTNSNTDTKPSTDTNKKPTFSSVNQKVYAKETVSIRDNWSTSGKLLGTLQKGSSITRTGIGSNGWDRVTYNGRTAYISHTYLTTTKPKDDKDDDKDKDKDKNNTANEVSNNTANNEVANNTSNNEVNNQTNDITNSETNEATNTQAPGNTEKDKKKGFSVNTIEIIIISVIVLAIIVIIINEILAKKREEKRREARKKDEKRVKGSRR